MKIVPIFAKDHPSIFALKKIGGIDEFRKAFSKWSDAAYLFNFFEANKEKLLEWGNDGELVESAVEETIKEAYEFNIKLLRLAENFTKDPTRIKLDLMFEKLHEGDESDMELLPSKSRGIKKPSSWLRIYAIKIEPNCYLVTGSMIKLTQAMQETKEGKRELATLQSVKNFLEINKIATRANLIDYINENTNK